ncbi:hypothetical protein QUF49_14020 [Fictibacillus sp. b24]|uniref:hypothetical protein n=1 Tax=Fictibacillus sp. b24 TaxID=3055863 RepID=UPI0025A2A44C|nr:hypothetical protein [Fictibacillus sp. b24]MDM5317120.1 hypothetical protein [Fictibacillus sp. b24]
MTLRFPITFALIMLVGPIMKFFIPNTWEVWQYALLSGVTVGILLWGIYKIGLDKKTVPIWLGVSMIIAAFFGSIYLAELLESQI